MGFIPNIGAMQAAMHTGIYSPEFQAAINTGQSPYTPEQIEAAKAQSLGQALRVMQGLPPKPTLRQRIGEILRGR
jgi:hypothetical protein